ncbi:hypothetical protein [Mycobacterium sp. 050134]|uniref:hypothetical protein n=1 Tax=Mycobacterium sp. 050134 TaxID=3096111 RepID=UPI002EDB5339
MTPAQLRRCLGAVDFPANKRADQAAARRSHTKPGLAENVEKDIGPPTAIAGELGENRGS